MIAHWPGEHRRLLGAAATLIALIVLVLVLLTGPSSAGGANGSGVNRGNSITTAQRELKAAQSQVAQLQSVTTRQSAEISALTAQLHALRHPRPRSHHRR